MSVPEWSRRAIAELTLSPGCPVCGYEQVADAACRACGADFRGPVGGELWQASLAAASALRARQDVLDRVPRGSAAPPLTPAPARTPAPTPVAPAPVARAPRGASSSATVQSVLAIAGAGLVAVAALVFTFFNADLQEPGVRTTVVAIVAILFVAGAWMLAKRGLRTSAEAVGALALVFLTLVIATAPDGAAPRAAWAQVATTTLLLSAAVLALGWFAKLRVWLSVSVVALAAVPSLYGAAMDVVAVGALASAFAALALVRTMPTLARRGGGRSTAERRALTATQASAAVLALAASATAPADAAAYWLGNAVVLALVAALGILSVRHPAGSVWALTAGATGVLAFAMLPEAAGPTLTGRWLLAALPAAAGAGVIALTLVSAHLARRPRVMLAIGALVVLVLTAVRAVAAGLLVGAAALIGAPVTDIDLLAPDAVAAVATGLAATAAALAAAGWVDRRATPNRVFGTPWLRSSAIWWAVAATLVVLAAPATPTVVRIGAALAIAIGAAVVLTRTRWGRALAVRHRLPVIVGAHAAVVLSAALAVRDDAGVIAYGGAGVIAGLLLVSTTVPRGGRYVHVGAAWAYGLCLVALLLLRADVSGPALLCVVAVVGGVGAIVATFTRVAARSWTAILVVTAAPFAAGVVQVVFERSAWTALSTGVLFALAVTLTVTRRPGLRPTLRAIAAGTAVPALAVVIVCLGAVLLTTSGSPVVLPVIGTLVALVLPARLRIRAALAPRIGTRSATGAALAIEVSTLVTAAIAVALSVVRDAAGAGTTLVLLLVLAVGAAAQARWAPRPYAWWLAGAALTGALWATWLLAGVDLPEAFLLPPALGAAVVGVRMTARGRRGVMLYGAALAAAVAPLVALLASTGSPGSGDGRALALVTASAVLTLTGTALSRFPGMLRPLAPVTLVVAIVAGAAGAVQGVRWGTGLDAAPAGTLPLVAMCLGMGVAGALPAAVSGWAMRPEGSLRRTALVPATLYVPLSAWTAIAADGPTVWTMWALMLALLVAMVAIAFASRARETSAPPVPLLFALAFVTAIVGWSPRELRVEWFSLPLGLFLIAAGAAGLAPADGVGRALRDWPRGTRGSWMSLAPGLLVVFAASVSATYTDPQTWRAILVIALALTAILVGASARLAAPFVMGIVVLPIENALAFVVQIGRGIQSMPWWITLSVVGAVLLIIAVTYERRSDAGFVARLRDLR